MVEIKEWLHTKMETHEMNLKNLKKQREQIDIDIQKESELLHSSKVLYENETGEKLVNLSSNNHQFTNMSIAEAAFEVLKKLGNAHAAIITDEIIKGGKIVGGEQPHITVSSTMRQDKRFEKVGKAIFRIKPEKQENKGPEPINSRPL